MLQLLTCWREIVLWSQVDRGLSSSSTIYWLLCCWASHLDLPGLSFLISRMKFDRIRDNVGKLWAPLLAYVHIKDSVNGRIQSLLEWNCRSFGLRQDWAVWCCNLHSFIWADLRWKKIANIWFGAYLSLAGAMCLLELWFVALWLVELGGDNKT